MEGTSFASRRPAAQTLSATFSLPPPSEIPSTLCPRPHPLASHASAPASVMSSESHDHDGPHRGQTTESASPPPPPPPRALSPHPASHFIDHGIVPQPQPQTQNQTSLSPQSPTTATSFLTPSPGVQAELSSPSPGINSGNAAPSTANGMYYGIASTTTGPATNHWQTPGQSYTYSTASPATSGTTSIVPQSSAYSRPYLGAVSSPVQSFSRNSSSPANGESLPTPSAYQDPPSFSNSLSSNGGILTAPLAAPGPPPGALGQPMLNSQAPSAGPQPPTPVSAAGPSPPESGYRSGHTPSSYYTPTSTPQQHAYPAFAGSAHPSPPILSPTTTSAMNRGLASIAPQGAMLHPLGYSMHGRSPPQQYGGFGHVMSNMHQPNSAMSMMGLGYGPGPHPHPHAHTHGHYMPQNYGHGQAQSMADRPFKCDQCPQSFNRNHDLKRHKRIHLAVKPFPCTFCDKSFSRKDALKRHRLVKGCGEKLAEQEAANQANQSDDSPRARTETGSEDAESPRTMIKKE